MHIEADQHGDGDRGRHNGGAQGMCFMALTTVSPSAEISTIRIMQVPTKAAFPAMAPSSSRAIWPRLRTPTRRACSRVSTGKDTGLRGLRRRRWAAGRQAMCQETNGRGASGKRWSGGRLLIGPQAARIHSDRIGRAGVVMALRQSQKANGLPCRLYPSWVTDAAA